MSSLNTHSLIAIQQHLGRQSLLRRVNTGLFVESFLTLYSDIQPVLTSHRTTAPKNRSSVTYKTNPVYERCAPIESMDTWVMSRCCATFNSHHCSVATLMAIALEDNTWDVITGIALNCRQCLAILWLVSYWMRGQSLSVICRRRPILAIPGVLLQSWYQCFCSVRWICDSLYASKDYYRSVSGLRWIASKLLECSSKPLTNNVSDVMQLSMNSCDRLLSMTSMVTHNYIVEREV
jgi:hypothetical protein